MRAAGFQPGIVIRAFAVAVLLALALQGVGCGGGDDGAERAVEWQVDRPVGPDQIRLAAKVETCAAEDQPLLEEPLIEYSGNDAYIELRTTPEELPEDQTGCFLSLIMIFKAVTLERDLDELTLFDASTDPPEQRWPR
jgi:hypothetical protein